MDAGHGAKDFRCASTHWPFLKLNPDFTNLFRYCRFSDISTNKKRTIKSKIYRSAPTNCTNDVVLRNDANEIRSVHEPNLHAQNTNTSKPKTTAA